MPNSYYDGFFQKVPGSVGLPSASYSFNKELVDLLKKNGVGISELTLHCNLGSLENSEFYNSNELLDEYFEIPYLTIRNIMDARKNGRKVVAVGTTAVRALETFALIFEKKHIYDLLEDEIEGRLNDSFRGSTRIMIDGKHKIKMVDDIIMGIHEHDGSHIRMLESFTSVEFLKYAYKEAFEQGFEGHEFGDLFLIPRNR